MIFQRKVARPRIEAVRAGWNDAAWGRPQRQVEADLAQFYESGYSGGMIFRHKQQSDLVERSVASKPLPHTHQQPERLNHHPRQATGGVGRELYGDQCCWHRESISHVASILVTVLARSPRYNMRRPVSSSGRRYFVGP